MRTLRHVFKQVLKLALLFTLGSPAFAQDPIELKIATYVPDQHPITQWLFRWGDQLARDSGGRITIKRFPSSQLGPGNQHYDFARTGQADIGFFFHGGTPGRMPLTELINLPYMVGSAEIGTKVLNDATLRSKYLDAEHRGTKLLVLLTHQPGGLHTTRKIVRSLDDLKGMRIRFPSPPIREFLRALGAAPVGVPPLEVAEQLGKNVIDGTMTDYGGAAIGLSLGGVVKHTTELYVYVTSFGVAMNEATWNKLSAELQKLVISTIGGREKEIGLIMDGLDPIGKKMLADQGSDSLRLAAADEPRIRRVAEEVSQQFVKELEAKKLPGREVYDLMRTLATEHAKTSHSFWK